MLPPRHDLHTRRMYASPGLMRSCTWDTVRRIRFGCGLMRSSLTVGNTAAVSFSDFAPSG